MVTGQARMTIRGLHRRRRGRIMMKERVTHNEPMWMALEGRPCIQRGDMGQVHLPWPHLFPLKNGIQHMLKEDTTALHAIDMSTRSMVSTTGKRN